MATIQMTSRDDDNEELKEMEAFVRHLNDHAPDAVDAVESLFYNSKISQCDISLRGTPSNPVVAQIRRSAHVTLSQYNLAGDYYHGLPLELAEATAADAEEAELLMQKENSAENDLLAEEGIFYTQAEHDEIEMRADRQLTAAMLERPKGFARLRTPAPTFLEMKEKIDPIIKGKQGENALNNWFKSQGIGYVAICQAVDTFAPIFANGVKRPDFIMLLEGVGLVAIDAKNKTSSSGGFTLELTREIKRAIAFERLFRMPLWYAFCDCEAGMTQWYWISALKAVEVGDKKTSSAGDEFLAIDLCHFEEISEAAHLAKLYTHRFPSHKKASEY